ncbi:MAG: hypothetical protein ACREHV_10595 [Rhizomicrobium sp.]
MTVLRRVALIGFVLFAPPLMALLLYAAAQTLLDATHHTIAPGFLWYAAAIELPIFIFFAVLEAKDRW